jgi:hypothetical protein
MISGHNRGNGVVTDQKIYIAGGKETDLATDPSLSMINNNQSFIPVTRATFAL